MKGDSITVHIRNGVGSSTTIIATVSGRTVSASVEKDSGINWLVVTEATRGGTVIHEARFTMTDVVMWEKKSA
jgi:hypothetical protein